MEITGLILPNGSKSWPRLGRHRAPFLPSRSSTEPFPSISLDSLRNT